MTPAMTSPRAERYRLVTRSDFDGLVCAALLKHLGILDDILFVHPKDVQDGKVEIGPNDVTTNLPYSPDVAISFDHHTRRPARRRPAREPRDRPRRRVRRPRGLRLLRRRRGLPRHRGAHGRRRQGRRRPVQPRGDPAPHRLGDAQLPDGPADRPRPLPRVRDLQLPADDAADRRHRRDVDREVFETPDVNERVELYNAHAEAAEEQIRRCATVHGNLVVLDLRDEEVIHPTNRFTLYALFPQCNISIHMLWGLREQNTVFATGKSILDRGSKTNVGELMLELRRRRPRGGRHVPGRERGRAARARRAGRADQRRRLGPRGLNAADAHLAAGPRHGGAHQRFRRAAPSDESRGRPADVYGALLRSITGQQLSVKAARAIYGRLIERFGGRPPTPEELLADDPERCAPPPASRAPRSRRCARWPSTCSPAS